MELLLKNKDIDIPFCISWANEDWTNVWKGENTRTLISQTYGQEKQWKEHFDYLLPFMKDDRYIEIGGKPLFIIYRPELIPRLNDMISFFNDYAIKNGIRGLCFAYQHADFGLRKKKDDHLFDFQIEYQPMYARIMSKHTHNHKVLSFVYRGKELLDSFLQKHAHVSLDLSGMRKHDSVDMFDYDSVWNMIIKQSPVSEKSLPGAYVDWDNTPRRGRYGSVAIGATPEKFNHYLRLQIRHAKEVYKKNMIFLFAWNEWAEGGYLEPDERYKMQYLKAVRDALQSEGEMP